MPVKYILPNKKSYPFFDIRATFLIIQLVCFQPLHVLFYLNWLFYLIFFSLISKSVFSAKSKMLTWKVNKTIGLLLQKLQSLLPRSALIIINKAFVRPHLDYGDIIFDEGCNASFHQKLELFQYNACLAIARAIRGTSKEKLYQELELESLQFWGWFRKPCFFYKIYKSNQPSCLSNIVSQRNLAFNTRNVDKVLLF